MDPKIPAPPPKRRDSSAQASHAEGMNINERGKFLRLVDRDKHHYTETILKKDPSYYLNPTEDLEVDCDSFAKNKLIGYLDALAQSREGCCIVGSTIQYFERSSNVIQYVDILLRKCLNDDYILEVTTSNFCLISNLVLYGESIKNEMFKSLKRIHDDLLAFGYTYESTDNPPIFLQYYDHFIVMAYYKFVSLLFFRMRRLVDADYPRRYESLASLAFSALKYLYTEQSLESLKLLTRLVQLNYHSVLPYFFDKVLGFRLGVISARQCFEEDDEEWKWLSCVLDIIDRGPNLGSSSVYMLYLKHLGAEFKEYVVYGTENVQILDPICHCIIAGEKLDYFHINIEDFRKKQHVSWVSL